MKTKILLVGGRGYLGRHIHAQLIDIYDVYITGTSDIDLPYYYYIEYSDSKSYTNIIAKFDLVIILASSITGLGQIDMSNKDVDTNVYYYKNFLQYLINKKNTNKLLYISSMTVYGVHNTIPVKEDGNLNPTSIYGLSKLMGEQLTKFACEMNHIKGVNLRIPGLFGGNRRSGFIYNTVIKCLKNEQILIDTSTLGYWESIDVQYLAFLIKEFIQFYDWSKFNTYNISYGEETDIINTAYQIKRLTNSKSDIKVVGKEGYIPFYLSNEKFSRLVNIEINYAYSLSNYINNIMKC